MLNYNATMPYIKRISSCFFICFFPALPLLAETKIDASAKLLNFNYEEFDQSGQSLDKETGIIPGLSITASKTLNNYTNTIGFEAYNGQVDYDGHTQSGTPHTTITDEKLYQLFYKLNWSPADNNSSIYGRVAWQQWDRNILPANNISGLFEQYQWWTFEAGLLATIFENDINKLQLEFGVSKISNGTIKIDLDAQGFGQPELNLGNGSGISAALIFMHNLTNRDNFGLSLEHRYWTFGRSNSKTISNGLDTITITEPRSVSNHTIVSIIYRHYF